jgi:hypothetical protein
MLGYLGILVFLIGYIWIIVLGFKVGGVLWGILNIFFEPLTGLIFCIMKKTGWLQLGLMIVGIIIIMLGGGMTSLSSMAR